MQYFICKCLDCGIKRRLAIKEKPYPEIGDVFLIDCTKCKDKTKYTRVLSQREEDELRREKRETALRSMLAQRCAEYNFRCGFLDQSVIITTALAAWKFDYHESRITLYHENTVKIDFATGNPARFHVQFAKRNIEPLEVVEYIAKHDAWRAKQRMNVC